MAALPRKFTAQTADLSAQPSRWQAFKAAGMGRPSATDKVTVYRSASIRLSEDIVERLGRPDKVQLLTSDDPNEFAICAATSRAGAMKLSMHPPGRQSEFKAWRLLKALGKTFAEMEWPLDLPHTWEGDILVIDISEMPEAEAAS